MNKKLQILLTAIILNTAAIAQETVADTTKAAAAPVAASPTAEAPVAEAPAPADTTISEKQSEQAEAPSVVAPADTNKVAEPAAPVADTTKTVEEAPVQTVQKDSTVQAPAETMAYTNVPADTVSAAAPTTKKWYHLVGLGATVPVSQYKIDHKKIDAVNYGVNLSYLGMASNGLSIKLGVSAGGSVTDNIKFEDSDDWLIGDFSSVEGGLGYTFGCPQKFMLSILAVVGFETVEFESDEDTFRHSELGIVDRSYQESLGGLTLGGDILVRVALGNHIGLFASVGGRWIPVTASVSSVRYEDDDYVRTESYTNDGHGVYSVVPTIGAMWSF